MPEKLTPAESEALYTNDKEMGDANFINNDTRCYGYYFSYPQAKCVEGVEPPDPQPKITACIGKNRYDDCSWIDDEGQPQDGRCDSRFVSELYCIDTIYT